ncbi:MAG: hypothetical protein K2M79_03120 [Muribaculaceae bacterium]|nr:hypothetical protein [Muribaculaceae bacterium]
MKVLWLNGYAPDGTPKLRLVADSAAVKHDRPVFAPDYAGGCRGVAAVAVRISRLGLNISPRFAERYFSEYLPVLLILPESCADVYGTNGLYLAADNTFVTGDSLEAAQVQGSVELSSGAASVTVDCAPQVMARAIAAISRHTTLKLGDIVVYGSECLPLPVAPGENVKLSLQGEELVRARIK